MCQHLDDFCFGGLKEKEPYCLVPFIKNYGSILFATIFFKLPETEMFFS